MLVIFWEGFLICSRTRIIHNLVRTRYKPVKAFSNSTSQKTGMMSRKHVSSLFIITFTSCYLEGPPIFGRFLVSFSYPGVGVSGGQGGEAPPPPRDGRTGRGQTHRHEHKTQETRVGGCLNSFAAALPRRANQPKGPNRPQFCKVPPKHLKHDMRMQNARTKRALCAR